ncbi:hypothetical protein PLICRDRAFT_96971 [Plicaturopsis crispa FD-325 SS-3]|nr:hypothetical protein PLICRDRAFT_96971 [Plicaturopsis crispa FD-325 SS-3]
MINRRSFEDFDLYTMQRNSNALDEFLHWKEIAESHALNAPLVPGTTLAVKPSAFFARHALLRSPYPPGAPPRETLNVVTQHHRPRCTKLDDILATEPTPTFEITSVVRSGPNHWSQVFFGRVRGSSQLVCLKLFDDRLFHLPDLDDYDECPPERRLQTFNRATDMMRREESVYDRLTHLQGSLVPHCYSFHEFVLPDGWHLWGLITEVIDGPPLLDLPLGKYPSDAQATLVNRIRHGVRALKYAGVEQTDWHLNQILCPDVGTLPPGIVFIDFAFALLWLADSNGTPFTSDCQRVRWMLKSETEVNRQVLEEAWFPEDLYED